MTNSHSRSDIWRSVAAAGAYLIGAGIVIVCAVRLASALTREDLGHAAAVFGLGLAMICAVLWVADAASIIVLQKSVRHALWVTFIAGVLAAALGFIKGAFLSSNGPNVRLTELLLEVQRVVPETIVMHGHTPVPSNEIYSAEALCPRYWIAKDGGFGPIVRRHSALIEKESVSIKNGWKVTAWNRGGPGRGDQLLVAQVTCERPDEEIERLLNKYCGSGPTNNGPKP